MNIIYKTLTTNRDNRTVVRNINSVRTRRPKGKAGMRERERSSESHVRPHRWNKDGGVGGGRGGEKLVTN